MIKFFKERKKRKQIEAELDKLFRVLIVIETMQINGTNKSETIDMLLNAIFVFTSIILNDVSYKEISDNQKIKCNNYSNKYLPVSEYIRLYQQKSYEIAENLEIETTLIKEIFDRQSYFWEIANKFSTNSGNQK